MSDRDYDRDRLKYRNLAAGQQGSQEPGFLPRPRAAIMLAAVARVLAYWRGDSRIKLIDFEREASWPQRVGAEGVVEVIYTLNVTGGG